MVAMKALRKRIDAICGKVRRGQETAG